MARVYVGTYAKYNDGNLFGAWLELEDYIDHDDFIEACKELHKDEEDPELMFQDFEDFPRDFYGESSIDPDVWDWLELDDDDRELLAVYHEHIDSSGDIDKAREAFGGKFDSEEDWAEQFWDGYGMLQEIPESLRSYIDYTAYARDCRLGGDMTFVLHNGYVWAFNNNV